MIPTRDHIHKLLPLFEPASFIPGGFGAKSQGAPLLISASTSARQNNSKGIEVKKWVLQLKQKDQKDI